MATSPSKLSESIIATGLTVEGKIEGQGHVRMAGRFKGTVRVTGELTIEPGAVVEGDVNADSVLVLGKVQGQLIAPSRVEFTESGVLIGDLKTGSLTVAAGSRMQGQVEFGWKARDPQAAALSTPAGPAHPMTPPELRTGEPRRLAGLP